MTIKKLKKQLKYYKKLSLIDDLTGIYNRRKLQIDMGRFLAEKKRYKYHYTIIFFDIDNFKKLNDNYGHPYGDSILIKVSNILKSAIRRVDRIYRYGGDEFIVILSRCTNPHNFLIRIAPYFDKEHINITFGTCNLKEGCLEEVDRRMYLNKKRRK